MHYRFDKKAIWHKRVHSAESEQVRGGVAGVAFACFAREVTKGHFSPVQGTYVRTKILMLQTPDPVAEQIEAGDEVEFEGYRYSVSGVQSVRSLAHRKAREYQISLE
jgi:hypothetical protein